MDPIIAIEGEALRLLLDNLHRPGITTLRFAIDDGGLKVKLNNGIWSPPLGKIE